MDTIGKNKAAESLFKRGWNGLIKRFTFAGKNKKAFNKSSVIIGENAEKNKRKPLKFSSGVYAVVDSVSRHAFTVPRG